MPPVKIPAIEDITKLKKSLSALVSEGWMEKDENWLISHSNLEFTKGNFRKLSSQNKFI